VRVCTGLNWFEIMASGRFYVGGVEPFAVCIMFVNAYNKYSQSLSMI